MIRFFKELQLQALLVFVVALLLLNFFHKEKIFRDLKTVHMGNFWFIFLKLNIV